MSRFAFLISFFAVAATTWACGGVGSACVSDGECGPGLYCHPNFPGQGITPADGEVSPPPSKDGKCNEGQPQDVPAMAPDDPGPGEIDPDRDDALEPTDRPTSDTGAVIDSEATTGEAISPSAFFAGMDGVWFGEANPSPFGEMPYALVIQNNADSVVVRADPPAGMGLPDGAYQQFVFAGPLEDASMAYETSLAGELLSGTMPFQPTMSGPLLLVFCNSAEAGGCEAMTVSYAKEDEVLVFTTQIRGTDHSVMRLSLMVPPG